MEEPKIPDSIRSKFFYFYIYIRYNNDLELLKKETSGKYTKLDSVITKIMPWTTAYTTLYDDESKIFECEITQKDIHGMFNNIKSGKSQEYNPPLFLKLKNKNNYPYIVSIPVEDFTNNEQRIISFHYNYELGNLTGFHPFTKKEPPQYYQMGNIKGFFTNFYNLYKDCISTEILNSFFDRCYSGNLDHYEDLGFLNIYMAFKIKNGIKLEQLVNTIKIFKNFSWDKTYKWVKYNKDERTAFYENVIEPLYLESSENHKKLYSILDEENKYIVDKLFITYDFKKNYYKYYHDESLLSSYLTTLEKKQNFYELYYDLLIDEGIYMKNFKYKNYFTEEFKKKSVEKYLRYEYHDMSFRTFDFAGEDKYDTYESGGGSYFRKAYLSSSYSLRKTINGKLLYIEDEVLKNSFSASLYILKRHLYLDKEILNLDPSGIYSTFSYDEKNIIVTKGGKKPFIYNLQLNIMNNKINFDSFDDSCYDAIKLKNNLIVVSGCCSFGYYNQSEQNFYKLIQTYKPEQKQIKLIFLIEFNDNLLISCFKDIEPKDKDEDNVLKKNEVYIGFHKMNYIEEEKKLNDENIIKLYEDIKLNKSCSTYKNILGKFSNSILGVGGEHDIYLINIENYNLVKTINMFKDETFCSFYFGDMNTIFICSRNSKVVSTFDEEFTVYSTSISCYLFSEDSLELKYLPRPSKKSREKESKCIIL